MIKMYMIFLIGILINIHSVFTADDRVVGELPKYRYCVPQHIIRECNKFTIQISTYAVIECVPGRDVMDCIDKVNQRVADFLIAEPEDMYVALHKNNEDFRVFSEIRTLEEPSAEFRYEGIILVHKNSNIHSLADLKGKKSCHTGYGRNVGYKIPITKLKKHGIFKTVNDPALTPVEKELKGLSELFSGSCLVGKYSPNAEFNQILKKRYPSLCALCEDPVKCDYPDKYSGYDGAIRCLADNGGDCAFTKTIYVQRHFGLPVGGNPSETVAKNNPDDFEYLCEDGTRRPVTGKPCTWAQRPWPGYMGNGDIVSRQINRLQDRIAQMYNEGKKSEDKTGAAKLSIFEKNVVVHKDVQVFPDQHLIQAKYKDVIERDGTMETKTRFCVSTDTEMLKCDVLRQAAYSRDIRPEFECIMSSDCAENVHKGLSDITVLSAEGYETARKHDLTPIMYEFPDIIDNYVAIAENSLKSDMLIKEPINYDEGDVRAHDAALYFSFKRNTLKCPGGGVFSTSLENGQQGIRIVKATTLPTLPKTIELICPDLSRKPISEFKTCNFDATLPRGIFVRKDMHTQELDNVIHGLVSVSEKFGHKGKLENVFELFGEFAPNVKNVLFDDDTAKFVTTSNSVPVIDEELYNEIHCLQKPVTIFKLYQPGHHY